MSPNRSRSRRRAGARSAESAGAGAGRQPPGSAAWPPQAAGDEAGPPAAAPDEAAALQQPALPFRIVGIGASAGGLEAVKQLLEHLPADTGMAFVLVQHLDPKHESLLPSLLARATRMPVVTAGDGIRVEPDHLYVIPPNRALTIQGGLLRLVPRETGPGGYLTIDRFFRSLAADQLQLGIGVILSGADSDGALGVAAIKEHGGVVLAQDPASAIQGGMPRHAIATGAVDLVGSPEQLARELRRLAARPIETILTPPAPDNGALRQVFRILHNAADVDFGLYKAGTVMRRISRRMLLCGTESLSEYAYYLQTHPAEVDSLYQDLLINVTRFFREPEAFESLRATAWPEILKARGTASRPIRVWVPGCSTEEECYSLAICLLEFLEEVAPGTPVQIFGTDVSEAVLERARLGIYPENITLDVSPERLRRFFTRVDTGYQIAKSLREGCIFARQNLLKDPPFSGIDLVSCRNVLIYLTPAAQQRILPLLHFALRPNGFLLLGNSETVGPFTDLFEVVDKEHNLFAKRAVPTRFEWDLTRHLPEPVSPAGSVPAARPVREALQAEVVREADRVLLDTFAPPGVLVTEAFDIVQFRGDTSPYLAPAPGQASLNLLKMLRPGLLPGVPRALRAARGRTAPLQRPAGRVEIGGRPVEVTVEVVPIQPGGKSPPYFLVLFHSARSPRGGRRVHSGREESRLPAGRGRTARLEQELAAAKEALRAIIDEQANVNEELRAANEEIVASNEELGATNEELEAAREELQATNEELTTINDQLQARNRELSQLTNDLTNLLASLNMPILMVGRDLRFRRITPLATSVLNIRPTDVGRPVGEIRIPLTGPPLEELIAEVIDTMTPKEVEVQDAAGRWYALRIRPYRTVDHQIDGAVVVLVDLHDLKTVAAGLAATREYASALVATVRHPLVVLDGSLRLRTANKAFYREFGLAPAEAEGRLFYELNDRRWDVPDLHRLLEDVLPRERAFRDVPLDYVGRDGRRRQLLLTARRVDGTGTGEPLILLAIEETYEDDDGPPEGPSGPDGRPAEKRAWEARAEAEAASRAKDVFLATLSHELRTPLTAMLGWIRMVRGGKLDAPTTARALEAIERNTRAQMQLIEDLLDVSRITSGKLRLDLRPVDLAAAVESAVDSVRPAAQAKRIRLDVDLTPLGGTVLGDRDRLQQVAWNLLSNAIKFTPEEGLVTVRLEPTPHRARLVVRDTGRGIDPEVLPRLFEPFRQAEEPATRRHAGLGLGLAIVRHLVELHGGTVTAASEGKGRGATFTVELPLATSASPPPRTPPQAQPALAGGEGLEPSETLLAGLRVLVVDDERDARDLLTAVLQQHGAEATAAASAREALEAIAQAPPDVLVADIAMPDEDGYLLLEQVRALPPERGGRIPAIAVTAYARAEDTRRALAAGFQVHLAKPLDPAVLALTVAQVAGRIERR